MQRVRMTKTVAFNGTMYLRGKEVDLDEQSLAVLSGRYEPVGKPVKVDVQTTALLQPEETTVVHQPTGKKSKPKKRKRKA